MAIYKTQDEIAAEQSKREFDAVMADFKQKNYNLYMFGQNLTVDGFTDKRLTRIIDLTDDLVNAANDIKLRLDQMGLVRVAGGQL